MRRRNKYQPPGLDLRVILSGVTALLSADHFLVRAVTESKKLFSYYRALLQAGAAHEEFVYAGRGLASFGNRPHYE
jgi:hypothetical protein